MQVKRCGTGARCRPDATARRRPHQSDGPETDGDVLAPLDQHDHVVSETDQTTIVTSAAARRDREPRSRLGQVEQRPEQRRRLARLATQPALAHAGLGHRVRSRVVEQLVPLHYEDLIAFHPVSSKDDRMTGHPVRLGADGRLVVVRTSPAEDPDRLRQIAQRLRAAAGAGAIDLVHVVDDGEHVELALAFAGRPLAAPVPADVLAPVAAALAAHLSDLQLRGVLHGAVTPEHVLVDADGTVRLCGFGHGDVAPSADVHALGLLLQSLLDPDDRSATADALRLHAGRCCADEAARPTMAAIAASLASIGSRGRVTPTAARAPSARRWPWAAAASVALLATLALVALPRVERAEVQREALPDPTTTTTAAPTTTTEVKAARVWPRSLERDGATWALGDADDRTVVADLDCDGTATPAVLQQPEGHVFVVDQWRDGTEARFVATIAGAIDLAVARTGDCEVLLVRTADGEIRLTP